MKSPGRHFHPVPPSFERRWRASEIDADDRSPTVLRLEFAASLRRHVKALS
jgi:hypothetical protein